MAGYLFDGRRGGVMLISLYKICKLTSLKDRFNDCCSLWTRHRGAAMIVVIRAFVDDAATIDSARMLLGAHEECCSTCQQCAHKGSITVNPSDHERAETHRVMLAKQDHHYDENVSKLRTCFYDD